MQITLENKYAYYLPHHVFKLRMRSAIIWMSCTDISIILLFASNIIFRIFIFDFSESIITFKLIVHEYKYYYLIILVKSLCIIQTDNILSVRYQTI